MKRLSLILLLLISCILVHAQQSKTTNTLLWRITGKGLTKPSYLYGTIHLMDKKVFFLGDSVYSAIDKSDGFAAELDLNSIGVEMINHFMKEEREKEGVEPVKLKDVVSREIWERYKSTLEERFGKKAETITVEELDELKDELEAEVFQKGDMPTFLDAHLFGLAKKKGKWVGGIEDMQDQLEHIATDERIENKIQIALYDEEYYRGGIDWMIKVYINQQLDSIDAMMYREESGEKDYIMIKRNLKMAIRMDSLSAIRSTFFAVGAAHLPGDSGVIKLLRSRGFTVTPVISSRKIDPSKYVLKSSEETWFPVEIKDSAYFLSMPGLANKFEMLEEFGLNTKLFFDLSFMKMYMTMSIELGERKKVGADSIFRGLKNQYAERAENVTEKVITVNGEQGRELRYRTDDGIFILQAFLPNMERLVVNAVMAFKELSVNDNDSKKFFQSFVVNKNARIPPSEEVKWSLYTNPIQAFSIEFPSKPMEKKDVRSEEGRIFHTLQAVDLKSQVFYAIKIASVKEGMYLPETDSSHLQALSLDIRMKFEDVNIIDSSIVFLNDFPACKILATAKSDGEKIVLDILSVLRGNKNYYLLALYQPGGKAEEQSKKFLNSFKLLPMEYPQWKTYTAESKAFSTTSPFAFRRYNWEEEEKLGMNVERVMVYDTLASHTLFIDRTIIPSWYWFSSDTAFLRNWLNKHIQNNDSLVGYTVKDVGNAKVAEFFVMQPRQTTIKKVKVIRMGNEVYDLYGSLAKADLDKSYHKFFEDFKVLQTPAAFDLTDPKLEKLKTAIEKGGKKEINEIKAWWEDLPLEHISLDWLQSLLLKAYPDFDSTYYNTLNWTIISEIKSIDSNHRTIDFIKNNYTSITKENNTVKSILLNYLCGVLTKESFDLAKQILADKDYPFDIDVYLPAYDSLNLTATLYPEFFSLAKMPGRIGWVSMVTSSLLDSNLISMKMILDQEKLFLDQAAKAIKEKGKNDDVYEYHELVNILGILNTPSSNKMLIEFSKYADREMKFLTMVAMLKNNLAVDSRTIYTLATTDDYRYKVYEELRKAKKQSLFPIDYLSQEKLAYSKLYADNKDDEYSLTVTNAGSRTITYKGKQQKVYLYKVFESDDEYYLTPGEKPTYYLAVGGPFSTNPKEYYSSHELTGVFWGEEFDEKKIDELLKKYLASLEEED